MAQSGMAEFQFDLIGCVYAEGYAHESKGRFDLVTKKKLIKFSFSQWRNDRKKDV